MAAKPQEERPAPAPARQKLTGILRGGIVAVGAETTGWVLETADRSRVDVNVSRVQAEAEKLEGQRVVVEGEMVTANWVERGEKPMLMADSIAPAGDAGK